LQEILVTEIKDNDNILAGIAKTIKTLTLGYGKIFVNSLS